MNFDELLDFLFHRIFGICITVASTVIVMLALTGCFPNDLMGCFWQGCGCTDCADVCYDCSDEENDCYYSACGGQNCMLGQCLFGPSGCQTECGTCYVDCGGANKDFLQTLCFGDGCGEGCYEVDGHSRYTCVNCTAYCDGTSDEGSPNFQRVFLFNLKVIDYNGSERVIPIYENTTSLSGYSTPSGMKFKGYFSEPGGKGTAYTDQYGTILIKPTSNVTLYAYFTDVFSGEDFTFIIFSPMSPENTTSTEVGRFTAQQGDDLTGELPIPTEVPGYTFRGWYATTNSSSIDINYANLVGDENGFHENLAIFNPTQFGFQYNNYYVSYVINVIPYYTYTTYSININYPEELFPYTSTQTYERGYGDLLYEITPFTHSDYAFAGYATDAYGGNILDEETEITSDLELYAIYREKITITFREEGMEDYNETYYDGEFVILPEPKNILPGQQYVGWSYHDDFSMKFKEITVSEYYKGEILVPHFTTANYKITYLQESGMPYPNQDTYQYNVTKPLMSISPDSYPYQSFMGWKNTDTGIVYSNGYLPNGIYGDITLQAIFTPKQYTATLDPEGGTVSNYVATLTYGKSFKLEVPKYAGRTFKHWYYKSTLGNIPVTDENGNSIVDFGYFDGVDYYGNSLDIQFYAAWNTNEYTVKFEYGGESPEVHTYQNRDTLIEPSTKPSKPGHTFIGWYYNNNKIENFSSIIVTSDMTIEARYQARVYSITFVISESDAAFSNGQTSITVNYTYGSGTISPGSTPIRNNWNLSGWSATFGGSAIIAPNGQVLPSFTAMLEGIGDQTEFTVYAKWAPI